VARLAALLFVTLGSVGISSGQSLAEHAKREAERRKQLESKGVEARIIRSQDLRTVTPPAGPGKTPSPAAGRKEPDRAGDRLGSLSKFRSGIERFDREMRAAQEKLASQRRRLEAELRRGRSSARGMSSSDQADRLRAGIQDLEQKIARLQAERRTVYDEGRRAGWQPGELDGKYVLR
jgi:hypothetical protein